MMNHFKNKRKRKYIVLYGSAMCLLCSVLLIYYWYFALAPRRNVYDPQWVMAHSQQVHYEEMKKFIMSGDWNHDRCISISYYADKELVGWLITHLPHNSSMGCLGILSHSDSILRNATNTDLGDAPKKWKDWWDKNRHKSQEQWLYDGFAVHGIPIDENTSPSEEIILKLMHVLGENNSPSYLKYNAYRWLRDKQIDPFKLLLHDSTKGNDDQVLREGLFCFSVFLRRLPPGYNVGTLNFARWTDPWPGERRSWLAAKSTKFIVNTAICGFMCLGIGGLIWCAKHSRREIELSASCNPAPQDT